MCSALSRTQPIPMISSCSLQSLSTIQLTKFITPTINLIPSSLRGDMPTTVLAFACQPRPEYSPHPITTYSPDGSLYPHIYCTDYAQLGDPVDISSAEPKRFATFVAQQRKKFRRSIVELRNCLSLRYNFCGGWRNVNLLSSGECRIIALALCLQRNPRLLHLQSQ